jgi:hypothetical protein
MKHPPSPNGDGAPTSRLTGETRGKLERHILESVKGTDRLILRELFGFLRGKALCWPGNAAIASAAGVCPRTVCSALKRLEEAEVIRTVDDSSTRSRRRIILLGHPGAADELARLEASPHTRFDRCRIGAPVKDKCHSGLQNLQGEGCTNCKPEVANFATESRNRSSARLEDPRPDGGTGGEKTLPNGNGKPLVALAPKPEEKPAPVAIPTQPCTASKPLTDHQLATKARAEKGDDPIAKAEWESMLRGLMLTAAPPQEIVDEVLGGASTSPVEFLKRLGKGSPLHICNHAVEVLCKTFGPTDKGDYRPAYQGVVKKVWKGVLSPEVLIHAFERACLPSADKPGRVFAFNVENRKGVQP